MNRTQWSHANFVTTIDKESGMRMRMWPTSSVNMYFKFQLFFGCYSLLKLNQVFSLSLKCPKRALQFEKIQWHFLCDFPWGLLKVLDTLFFVVILLPHLFNLLFRQREKKLKLSTQHNNAKSELQQRCWPHSSKQQTK